ncbi:TetR/AcrR family transcriptional regulator [uncultured Odoribacter sp.]|uniref:TetR/AcrR family transcriptional regulator n=1 Tax=uncultured Odoribacter sp. TaxID=876416 RepID=UPI00263213C1|nr:helix-turn-helix domain-containing protein [uncultured Odoribacter sp.]
MANTRILIIEKAFLLFLKKGFKAVKLSDIERAAGITKGTFYYHFTSKEEVLKEGLIRYYEMIDKQRSMEFNSITTLREYVDLTIRKMSGIHNYTAKSFTSEIPEVLSLSLLVEVIALFPELKKVTIVSKMQRLSKLEQLILEAKKRGELRNDADTSVLAKNILNISAGMVNYLVMHQDVSYALSAMRSQYEQLYSLVSVNSF